MCLCLSVSFCLSLCRGGIDVFVFRYLYFTHTSAPRLSHSKSLYPTSRLSRRLLITEGTGQRLSPGTRTRAHLSLMDSCLSRRTLARIPLATASTSGRPTECRLRFSKGVTWTLTTFRLFPISTWQRLMPRPVILQMSRKAYDTVISQMLNSISPHNTAYLLHARLCWLCDLQVLDHRICTFPAEWHRIDRQLYELRTREPCIHERQRGLYLIQQALPYDLNFRAHIYCTYVCAYGSE